MSLSFIGGKPGSGKTLYAVSLIIRELLVGERLVVTNVPLKVGRLNEYLQEIAPNKDIPLVGPNRRLVLLDDNDQAREFYAKYSTEYYATLDPEERERIFNSYEQAIKTMAISEEARHFWRFRSIPGRRFEEDKGALIVLDELHVHFNARKWAQTGDACLHYLSQHRKYGDGDDLVCITQALANVDKQFRSVAQDFTMVVNESKRKLGPFKGRNRFVRASYYSEPTPRAVPFERAAFELDVKGVASCYDTAAGVGVHGRNADKGKKTKGLPIMLVFPIGLTIVAVVAGVVPWGLGKLAGKFVGGGAPRTEIADWQKLPPELSAAPAAALQGNHERGAFGFSPNGQEAPKTVDLPIPDIPERKTVENPLYVAGIAVLNRPGKLGRFNVFLSDGRIVTEADGAIRRVTRSRVEFVGGESLFIGPPHASSDVAANLPNS